MSIENISVNTILGKIIMSISMYQASVPSLIRALNNLAFILEKGAYHAEAKQIESSVLIGSRLYPNMLPLSNHVQIVSDVARKGVARLAGLDAPAIADNETTFPELVDRIRESISYLNTFTPAQIDGTEEKEIVIQGRKESITLKGMSYLFSIVLPDVYFHATIVYAILRHDGVELGMMDFLGKLA
jgi:uncharacterized protein